MESKIVMPEALVLGESLRRLVCPGCSSPKRTGMSLCATCYRQLPRDLQQRMYRRLGNGYGKAMAEALTLVATEQYGGPFWPGSGGPRPEKARRVAEKPKIVARVETPLFPDGPRLRH